MSPFSVTLFSRLRSVGHSLSRSPGTRLLLIIPFNDKSKLRCPFECLIFCLLLRPGRVCLENRSRTPRKLLENPYR